MDSDGSPTSSSSPPLQAEASEITHRNVDAWLPSPLPGPTQEADPPSASRSTGKGYAARHHTMTQRPTPTPTASPPNEPAAHPLDALQQERLRVEAAGEGGPGAGAGVGSGKLRIARLLKELDAMLNDSQQEEAPAAGAPQLHSGSAAGSAGAAGHDFDFYNNTAAAAANGELRTSLRQSLGGSGDPRRLSRPKSSPARMAGGAARSPTSPPRASSIPSSSAAATTSPRRLVPEPSKPYATPVRIPAAATRIQAEWERRTTIKAARSAAAEDAHPQVPPQQGGGEPGSHASFEVTGDRIKPSSPRQSTPQPVPTSSPLRRLDTMMARFSDIGVRLARSSNGGAATSAAVSGGGAADSAAHMAAAGSWGSGDLAANGHHYHHHHQALNDSMSLPMAPHQQLGSAERVKLRVETLAATMSPASSGLAQASIKSLSSPRGNEEEAGTVQEAASRYVQTHAVCCQQLLVTDGS